MNIHGGIRSEDSIGERPQHKPLQLREAVRKVWLPLLRRIGSTSTKSRPTVELVFSVSKADAGPHLIS